MKRAVLAIATVSWLFSATAGATPISRLEVPFRVIWYSSSSSKYIYSTFSVLLWNDIAPTTTDNFSQYLQENSYSLSIVHRSVDLDNGTPFVIQTGGYWASEDADKTISIHEIADFGPIQNEFNAEKMSNVRGTIAMARTSELNSATNQWFVNLSDNLFLDDPQSPYTVFGQVITTSSNTGMTLLDSVGALKTYDFSASGTDPSNYAIGEVPLVNYTQANYDAHKPLALTNLVYIEPNTSFAVWRYMGDMNGDAKFDDVDLTMMRDALHDPWYPYRELGDVNGDGKFNAEDLPLLTTMVNSPAGDMNLDGVVNALDIAAFIKAVTNEAVSVGYKADMNGDGVTNSLDIGGFVRAVVHSGGSGGAMAVPEPASAGLIFLAGAGCLLRRKVSRS